MYVANNYRDQLKYFRYGLKAFDNYTNKHRIEEENNRIILNTLDDYLYEPFLIEFPYL